ncbi:segregation and condensation protein A [Euzebya tangerina]|uniref:segregation and condensation protein A n=1 Tax=Euzebya tangerina TaxID=591198 RepID=UPI000E31B920|nr:segregation/condensation protein A [Euzebya tangerina]
MSATYHVSVSAFEGPFDLLLHLIARRKVDIYEVSIAEITDDYLAVLAQMDTVDLGVTTEFLVVAATLVELKAARLLPTEDDPELDELALEARDLLYARLLDYRTFREAAFHLRERLDTFGGYVAREVSMEPQFAGLNPDAVLGVDPTGLALIAARAFAEQPDTAIDLSHIQPVRMTVREAAGMILDELSRGDGPLSFDELTAGCRHVAEVVVHFLACLELYKLEHVDLEQEGNFGSLRITWTPEAADALGGAYPSFELETYDAVPVETTEPS